MNKNIKNLQLYILFPSLIIFFLLAFINSEDGTMYFDQNIRNFALGISNTNIKDLMQIISLPGTLYGILITSLTLSIFAYFRLNLKSSLLPLLIVPLVAMNETIKPLIGRPRPGDASSFGFPSSHAFETILVMGLIWFIFVNNNSKESSKRILLGIMLLWSTAVGISRIYLDRHWFTDIIGGYALGIIILCLTFFLVNRIKSNN
ncbi:MAG: hypothetical protein CL785_05980 [Chloroflexi bacterium]|nr:hypothetical protein [Chloroflexota bacterium]|tara:strand:- start:28762 stop:29373 length:612 start_codon:yes stop_codon:yes gene_type:complete